MRKEILTSNKVNPLDHISAAQPISEQLVQDTLAWVRNNLRSVLIEKGTVIDPRYEAVVGSAVDGSSSLTEPTRIRTIGQYISLLKGAEILPTSSTLQTIAKTYEWLRPEFETMVIGSKEKPGIVFKEQQESRAQLAGTSPFENVAHAVFSPIEEEAKKRESDPSQLANHSVGREITNRAIRIGEFEEYTLSHLPNDEMMNLYFASSKILVELAEKADPKMVEQTVSSELVSQSQFEQQIRKGRAQCIMGELSLDDFYRNLREQANVDPISVAFWQSIDKIIELAYGATDKEVVLRINAKLREAARKLAQRKPLTSETVSTGTSRDPSGYNSFMRGLSGSTTVVPVPESDFTIVGDEIPQTAVNKPRGFGAIVSVMKKLKDAIGTRTDQKSTEQELMELRANDELQRYLKNGGNLEVWTKEAIARIQSNH